MNTEKKGLLCSKCCKRVSYHIGKRQIKTIVKDLEIEYEEAYGICDECNSEMFVPGLDDKNEAKVESEYRKNKGLISIEEIKSILTKYNIEKRPLSKVLGLGELTITRYIDGQIPSKKYSDLLIELHNNENSMRSYVEINKSLISEITYDKAIKAIEQCEKEKAVHNSAERIALYIISSGFDVTNLFLQKILYYVKAISELFVGKTIIPETCEAWKYGPVFPSVYDKYKEFGKHEIETKVSFEYASKLLTEEEIRIVNYVLYSFGIYNAWFLKDLTHAEEPWIAARGGLDEDDSSHNVMKDELISVYFDKINKQYNLTSAVGVATYVNDMKKRMNY